MSIAAKQLLEDVNTYLNNKPTLKKIIVELGYVFSGRHILVKLAEPDDETKLTRKMVVFELYDADDYTREVPFCFLYDRQEETGVIMPFPFSKYKDLVKKDTAVES
jgi:hypothetical protein